jgi:hypothetical protein
VLRSVSRGRSFPASRYRSDVSHTAAWSVTTGHWLSRRQKSQPGSIPAVVSSFGRPAGAGFVAVPGGASVSRTAWVRPGKSSKRAATVRDGCVAPLGAGRKTNPGIRPGTVRRAFQAMSGSRGFCVGRTRSAGAVGPPSRPVVHSLAPEVRKGPGEAVFSLQILRLT